MTHRRIRSILLSLLVVAGLAACEATGPAGARWAEPSKAAAGAPRPAPTTSAEAGQQVKLALLDLSTFRSETATHTSENTDDWFLRSLCVDALPSDEGTTGSRERRWVKSPVWIRQYVAGYTKVPGRKLIDELRTVLKTCKTYDTPDERKSTIVPWAPPGVPENPDVVTFCERQKTENGIVHQCTVMMARGHYVVEVDASDGDGDLKKSQAMMGTLYPLIADALVKAA